MMPREQDIDVECLLAGMMEGMDEKVLDAKIAGIAHGYLVGARVTTNNIKKHLATENIILTDDPNSVPLTEEHIITSLQVAYRDKFKK